MWIKRSVDIDFIGIGAQKSGTTWLHHCLSQHPQVQFPKEKELHYWDSVNHATMKGYRRLFPKKLQGKVMGEFTPAYAGLPVEIIQKIYQGLPKLKLIYIMRHPVERMWSMVRMAAKRRDVDLSSPQEAFIRELCAKPHRIKHGDYAACLESWLSVFPKDQMLLLYYEDLQQDPKRLLSDVCEFLKIDGEFFQAMLEEKLAEKVFAGEQVLMPSMIREELEALYRPKIQRLGQLLDKDFSHWLSD